MRKAYWFFNLLLRQILKFCGFGWHCSPGRGFNLQNENLKCATSPADCCSLLIPGVLWFPDTAAISHLRQIFSCCGGSSGPSPLPVSASLPPTPVTWHSRWWQQVCGLSQTKNNFNTSPFVKEEILVFLMSKFQLLPSFSWNISLHWLWDQMTEHTTSTIAFPNPSANAGILGKVDGNYALNLPPPVTHDHIICIPTAISPQFHVCQLQATKPQIEHFTQAYALFIITWKFWLQSLPQPESLCLSLDVLTVLMSPNFKARQPKKLKAGFSQMLQLVSFKNEAACNACLIRIMVGCCGHQNLEINDMDKEKCFLHELLNKTLEFQ